MPFKIPLLSAILILFITTANTVYPQAIIPRFEHLGINDGMPHSSVYSITQDKYGFMWFGTPNGLGRYDGHLLATFKYTATSPDDVTNNFVRGKLLEDREGNIWYSNESGIYKWDALQEKVLKVKPFIKADFENVAFHPVAIDPDGTIWLFNIVYGIFSFDTHTNKLVRYPLPPGTNYSKVLYSYSTADQSGNIWIRIVEEKDAYWVFNKKEHSYRTQLATNPPHAIFFSQTNDVHLYENFIVYTNKQNNKKDTFVKTINYQRAPFFSYGGVRDQYGRFWMTSRGKGLFYYDERHKKFYRYRHENAKPKSLAFDLTTCLYIDRNQNLWIGIDGGGVARLDLKQPRFNLFPLSEGDYPLLNDYFTKCFYEDEGGRIWFGSHSNGLNIFDPNTNKLINYFHQKDNLATLPGNIVACIFKDRDNQIWIGSSGGFSLFNEKNKSFKTIPLINLPSLQPDINTFAFKIAQLKNGLLVAATQYGIVKIEKNKYGNYEGRYFSANPELTSSATDILEMPDGTIYSTMPGVGMLKATLQKNTYNISNTFLNGLDIRSVRADEQNPGRLWVSTGVGLIHFNTVTEEYKIWNEKDGLTNSYVYGSLNDGHGGIWISTNAGLSYIDVNRGRIENYTYLDGLQSNEFNTQAFYKGPTGTLYFGGIKGFNWFKPGQIANIQSKPQAAITKVTIKDRTFKRDSSFSTNKTITAAYDDNDFNFDFAALDYTRPEANKIMYTLQGWDAGWITTTEKLARYSNLLPGNYTFRLKVCNAGGVWSNEQSVFIVIKAPFWKQSWFRIVAVLLLLLAVIYVTNSISKGKIKHKLALLERQVAIDTERNRISADMHDEIGSGITHIALLSELIQTRDTGLAEIKQDVRTIAISSRKLVQTMGEIIWALNPQNETLENLLAYIREQSHKYFDPFQITFTINFPTEVPAITLTNVTRRNIYMVTKELLSNAMKHSGGDSIQLSLHIKKNKCCFCVSDNGTGWFEKKKRPGRNGIGIVTKRMQDIGGTIEWLDGDPGTIVNYTIDT